MRAGKAKVTGGSDDYLKQGWWALGGTFPSKKEEKAWNKISEAGAASLAAPQGTEVKSFKGGVLSLVYENEMEFENLDDVTVNGFHMFPDFAPSAFEDAKTLKKITMTEYAKVKNRLGSYERTKVAEYTLTRKRHEKIVWDNLLGGAELKKALDKAWMKRGVRFEE